jgi:hypothetical protein
MQVIYKVWAKFEHNPDHVVHKTQYRHNAEVFCSEYEGSALVLWVVKTWERKPLAASAHTTTAKPYKRSPGKVLNYAS